MCTIWWVWIYENTHGIITTIKAINISITFQSFLNMTPKAQATKAQTGKWNYIKLKSFCTAKETINRMKMQPEEWEKIFTNHIPDKGLISKICKELNSITKTQTVLLKMGKGLEQTFLQRRHTKSQCECKNCLISLSGKCKSTMRCHLIPVRMAVI